jgi:hypothetical protein
MNEASCENTDLIVVVLMMTAAAGIVDAVSYLGLGLKSIDGNPSIAKDVAPRNVTLGG